MDTNKLVGWGLIVSVLSAFFTAIVIDPVDVALADGLYAFLGLAIIVFGIWGGWKLINK